MKEVLNIDSMNGKLQCLVRYSNGGIIITSDCKQIESEISKIIHDKVIKWKVDKNDKISIKFHHHIIILEDINLLNHQSLSKLKFELYRKLTEYEIKNLMHNGFKLVKNLPLKTKVIITVSAASISALAAGIAMPKSSSDTYNEAPKINYEIENKNEPQIMQIEQPTINQIIPEPVFTTQAEEISPQELAKDSIIKEYADMYFIDYETAKNLISEKSNEINDKSFPIDVIEILREYHNNDQTIDKTPIMSSLSENEKEKLILHFANIYGIYDEDELAILLAAHRVETGYGTSNVYLNYNNFGGVMVDGEYLKYKTVEIGAESFVRNFQIIMNNTIEHIKNGDEGYDSNISLAHNMDHEYCGETYENGEPTWGDLVDELSGYVKEEGILNDYLITTDEEKTIRHM